MESILAWVMGTKLGMLVGGAAGGMVLTTGFVAAKRMLPGLLAKWVGADRKSTRLNSSHIQKSRMPSSA